MKRTIVLGALCGVGLWLGAVASGAAMPVNTGAGASADTIIQVRAGHGGGGNRGNAHVNRGPSRQVNRNFNRGGNRNVNRNFSGGRRVGGFGGNRWRVRAWQRRPYYGTIIGGIALGTIIAVTAGVAPVAPADNLCWFWSDPSQVNGYWDYCQQ